MKNDSYKRIYKSQEYLSPLGRIEYRALFGGYSLAIEETVFAMVAEGELYLRVCEQSAPYRVNHPTPLLTLRKRGRPVLLNYYHVDDALWDDRRTLLTLSSHSLEEAQREKDLRYDRRRLKNLPNITFHMELMLLEAGIRDYHMLCTLGAELSWLKLREKRRGISVSVLFALEGAIAGVHAAALPAQRRQELMEWVSSLPGFPLSLAEKLAAEGDLSPGEA
ncbi:TfoX/Sxy family DNA transformation protein [Trabulsiella odontotermitis]|uniref:TfoX/Sxy family DNA transformation protein n=1 Tax=Trabulsiella odontotermitis TaxID=379893 RepID=UPI0024B777A8|nr:TfoX/Sxy family DNA transformation protein [Trabulsiella odontotermitis]WHP33009.1 TfoX/Sxy family DNA transformation protein [Trabulsiella odontotermitis]